ncbi:hypothetical protein ABK040_016877 [Willaertia magna]
MTPHSKTWEKSANTPVTILNKSPQFSFIGWERSRNNTNGKLVCFQNTGKGVFGGYIISVPRNEVTIPLNPKIEQPWFREEVRVYENSIISSVFDRILSQQLQQVTPTATYIQVMSHCVNQGIPVFIVGGAVRDVIYAIIKDKHKGNDISSIVNKVKDIDIGFGCPPEEFCKVIKQKWPNEPTPPGPRGLVVIGSPNCELFLEGKAINGPNNDNQSVAKYVPKTYGTDLVNENICRDFTCNSLWYDPINKCIIDPTGDGQGIKDVLEKVLRIPVKREFWNLWVKGNPSKIMRYYKFIQKGYKPADEETRQFIIESALKYSKEEMECANQLRIGVMHRKTDTHAQQKKQEFLNAISNDLGDDFVQHYFPNF